MANRVIVHHSRLLQSTLAAVHRPNFCYNRLTEIEFVGEGADDDGGPRRKYFRYVAEFVVRVYLCSVCNLRLSMCR